ncbi:Sigma-54 interaction domain-containing protein [Desulfatibacillum alkenivorans DSM 16219]|jgi:DNA-binding NtrC family response regulator|uniref:Sigma-54 interaction domain-containing protein n=1 Tax=Desulfatibacillum alkenivorans DSM 16219 TaxID=1121393 RepID=A0A1M6CS83_9BACT|nr:sigma 54-interacting transcriptional regulator [Desulfatibacillum alkenivorans]SHI63882.1 Sigma-54 interaction domain-containing protein [Desulfatibacillum alkenivorans DSM 16219]
MPQEKSLTSQEREFFTLVQKAAIANPFGEQRLSLDLQIASGEGDSNGSHQIDKTLRVLEDQLLALGDSGRDDLNAYSGEDKKLLEDVFLFDFFYRFRKKFDDHIRAQIKADDKILKLNFAGEAIAVLQSRGFNPSEIKHAIEMGYQLRRAFYFINQSLIGRSQIMKKLRFDLWNNIFTHNLSLYDEYLRGRMEDFSTLLLGETGTGKGTVAAAIGRSGHIPFNMKRRVFTESFTSNFKSINLSQYPENLIESELFGHKKGSFTGAVENHIGVLENCSPHGSILLDEIGEISQPVQIKLLQVLQERFFHPVGSHIKAPFHGRVIGATNQKLNELRSSGKFRDDFFYRLCSDVITVPPLRRRIQEDPLELDDLLSHIVSKTVGKPSPELVNMVKKVIEKNLGPEYPWYGNVRELEQCVRRVLLKKDYGGDKKYAPTDLQSKLAAALETGDMPAQMLMAGYCKLLHARHGTFEEVARRISLDRRTVTKYISEWDQQDEE